MKRVAKIMVPLLEDLLQEELLVALYRWDPPTAVGISLSFI